MAWQKASPKQHGPLPSIRLGPGHNDGSKAFYFARISEQLPSGQFHVTLAVCLPMQKGRTPNTVLKPMDLGYYQTIGEAQTAGKLALSQHSTTTRKERNSGNPSTTKARSRKAPG